MEDIKDCIIIKPTASGFGKYVYCGVKLFLDKNPKLDSFRKGIHDSYEESQKSQSLKIGKQNEHKCIEWIMTRYKTGSILFDGTGRANKHSFTTNISPFKVTLHCRPDLIIKHEDQTILYEFKSVGERHYLTYPEFDSTHAQVWCYRFIKDFKTDRYYSFRYFEDPSMQGAFPSITELKNTELSDEKFIPLFKQYIDAIKTINRIRTAPMRPYSNNILSKFYKPINEPEKCDNCIYSRYEYCDPRYRPR